MKWPWEQIRSVPVSLCEVAVSRAVLMFLCDWAECCICPLQRASLLIRAQPSLTISRCRKWFACCRWFILPAFSGRTSRPAVRRFTAKRFSGFLNFWESSRNHIRGNTSDLCRAAVSLWSVHLLFCGFSAQLLTFHKSQWWSAWDESSPAGDTVIGSGERTLHWLYTRFNVPSVWFIKMWSSSR